MTAGVDFSELGDVVEDFSFGALPAVRPGAKTPINGRTRPGPDVAISVFGSFWPVLGKRRTQLTEGGRFTDPQDVYTEPQSVRLQTVNDSDQSYGDILTLNGREYEVVEEHQWTEGLFGHYIVDRIQRRDP